MANFARAKCKKNRFLVRISKMLVFLHYLDQRFESDFKHQIFSFSQKTLNNYEKTK